MNIRAELERLIGSENVFDSPEFTEAYSKDYSLTRPSLPNYVVQPKETTEIQGIMRLANEHRIPVIPSSSQVHFYGATIPSQGGIILDLRRMNRILNINEVDMSVQIEPGVTWQQLQTALTEKGYRCIIPLLPHSLRSVLTTWLEVEYPVSSVYEYGMPLQSMHIVWADGEEYTTGSASVTTFRQPGCYATGVNPQGPGAINFFKLFQGAQGTVGIVTWAMLKFEEMPRLDKAFFIPTERIEDAIEPMYKIHRRRISSEFLLLNNFGLAAILAENWPGDFERLRQTLPPWTTILILSGLRRRPEEKIEYEEEALREIMKSEFPALELLTVLPSVPTLERRLPQMLRQPWPKEKTYWKHNYKGGCQDLFFITTLDKVPKFVQAVSNLAGKRQYHASEVGCYIQPIENARACHCEFNFYYNSDDPVDREKIWRLYEESARTLLDMGAFFSRPYGILADMVYSRATSYTEALKKFKNLVDPNNIMSPGNLCF